MSNGLQLLILLVWAFGGPGTAIFWLGLPYGWIGGIVWLVVLVILARVNPPKNLEDTTNTRVK
jgi:hypothetical protein